MIRDERTAGRPPGIVTYANVTYNDAKYIVATIKSYKYNLKFVIDGEDFDKIKDKCWHLSSEKYVGNTFYTDDKVKKELYIHNVIMNRDQFKGKGQKETVDHINRNGLDNRKANLRVVSQSSQNMNQGKRKRNIFLPEDCDIKVEDIPKHIWYMKEHGSHGDRFVIEFKTKNLDWKSTSSKKVSLKEKLAEAQGKLAELYVEFPELHPDYEKDLADKLNKSLEEILALSTI